MIRKLKALLAVALLLPLCAATLCAFGYDVKDIKTWTDLKGRTWNYIPIEGGAILGGGSSWFPATSTTLPEDFDIPAEVDGRTVRMLAVDSFASGSCGVNLKNVWMPNTVTNIGAGAFSGCSKLVSRTTSRASTRGLLSIAAVWSA